MRLFLLGEYFMKNFIRLFTSGLIFMISMHFSQLTQYVIRVLFLCRGNFYNHNYEKDEKLPNKKNIYTYNIVFSDRN